VHTGFVIFHFDHQTPSRIRTTTSLKTDLRESPDVCFLRSGFHVAEAGDEHKLTTTQMTNSQFSLANRKQLADLLADKYDGLRYKARQRFNRKAEALRISIISELAEKKGALGVVRKIEVAQKSIEDLSAELSDLGFELSYGDLRLRDRGSNPLNKAIATRVEKEIGTPEAIDARFDSAQIAMMTVASLEDAEKLLKSVSEI